MTTLRKYLLLGIGIMFFFNALAEDISFKGVALGSTKEELVAKFPGLRCFPTAKQYLTLGEETCVKRYDATAEERAPLETYAGQPVSSINIGIADGLFGYFSLTIDSHSYERIKSVVESNVGQGEQTKRNLQAQGGMSLESKRFIVERPNGSLQISEHFGRIDRGEVSGTSKAFKSYVDRIREKEKQQGAKDI